MTLIEEYNKAQEAYGSVPRDGDYKDIAAAQYDACLNWASSGQASPEFVTWFEGAPDAHSCPRAWLGYMVPDDYGEEPAPLTGKWDDEYVQRLGVLEHCDEILALHRAQAVAKAEGRRESADCIGAQIECEMADLLLILAKRFGGSRLIAHRAAKFRP